MGFKKKLILLLALIMFEVSNARFVLAQAPTNIDSLFDDDEEDIPQQNFRQNPAGNNQNNALPTPGGSATNGMDSNSNGSMQGDSGRSGGGDVNYFPKAAKTPKASANASTADKNTKSASTKKDLKTKIPLKDANIEDITNENYPDEVESFDYPNADIADVVTAISELTGKNFIIDPGLHGKISIIAPSRVTVAEAYKAFLAALAINGFTVVPYGKFLKIKSAANAKRDSIQTYSGAYYPNSDVFITRIIHLKHISADDIQKYLRQFNTRDGEFTVYPPTNSIIITDYGTNVEKVTKIIEQLDKPGFDEQLAVVPIKFAKAKDLADLINAIINKDPTKGAQNNMGGFGVPRYRGGIPGQTGTQGTESLSLVTPDERTNAIIVVGNASGVEKVRGLVRKLDYKLDSKDGGVYVYYVRYGEAEKIAQTLTGVAQASNTANQAGTGSSPTAAPNPGFGGFNSMAGTGKADSKAIFGGDVKINADKANNSLVITASKQDYDVIKGILRRIDVQRDQVYVESIIMEMNSTRARSWDANFVQFQSVTDPTTGLKTASPARSGFSSGHLADLLSPTSKGAIIGFGSGETLNITLGSSTIKIPSLLSLISFLTEQTQGNILSTPQVLALDNEEASIEVGEKIPISQNVVSTANGQSTASVNMEDVNITLKITPHISPDSESVRLKLSQEVKQPQSAQTQAKAFVDSTTVVAKRKIDTNLLINSGDTAVLGGLIRDIDSSQETKVPVLGDLPIIGWLFKSSVVRKDKVNLVVFLTPKILRTNKDNHELLNRKAQNRIDWIKKNFNGKDPYGKMIEDLPRAEVKEGTERVKEND